MQNDENIENLSIDEINELFHEILELPEEDSFLLADCHDPNANEYK